MAEPRKRTPKKSTKSTRPAVLTAEDQAWVDKQMALANPSTHAVQAAAEGVAPSIVDGAVVGGQKVTLKVKNARGVEEIVGEYRMAAKIGLMPLLKFAHVSSRGIDSNDMDGLAAMYDMVRDSIDRDEWARFERDAIDSKAEADEIFGVVQQVIEALTARPTRQPPGSSPGRLKTSARSKGSSSLPDTLGLVSAAELTGRSAP